MSDVVWREILEGPRWAGLSTFVKNECWERGLKLNIDVEKGWIRETCRVEVSGPDAAIASLKREIYASLDAYNNRLQERKVR